jgi:hypothetical protein
MTAGSYIARIVEVPGQGIRLEPTEESKRPGEPTGVNLLGMAIALALGAAGYHHHAETRDPELQTLDALLAGQAVMPWRGETPPGDSTFIVCESAPTGAPTCHLEHRAA